MTTVQRQRIDKEFSFTSNDISKLLPALRLIYPLPVQILYTAITETGFRIARNMAEAKAFSPSAKWVSQSNFDGAPSVCNDIQQWLAGLSHHDARRICGHLPREAAYVRDPRISLSGYRVVLERTLREGYPVVTVTPAWV